jgi:hypothetical protein
MKTLSTSSTCPSILYPPFISKADYETSALRKTCQKLLLPFRFQRRVTVVALALAGCARNPPPREASLSHREVRSSPVRQVSRARVHSEVLHAELRVRRPDPALLAPQPAPNCEFKRADIKAVDADEWTRLKTEYERQCFQDAEKAARERLSQLQGSAICEIERAPQATAHSLKSAHARPGS